MTTATQAPATGAKGHIDPAAAFVPVQTRSERATSFDPDDFGMPTGREVNWKHTPVDRLRSVLVDEPVDVDDALWIDVTAPAIYRLASQGHDAAVRGEVFRPEDLPSALAWKHAENARHIRIPADETADEPIRTVRAPAPCRAAL